jgi:hypothetical protein
LKTVVAALVINMPPWYRYLRSEDGRSGTSPTIGLLDEADILKTGHLPLDDPVLSSLMIPTSRIIYALRVANSLQRQMRGYPGRRQP